MGTLSLMARINLNAQGFIDSLKTAEKGADQFANKLRNQVGGALLGVFGIRALVNIGKQAIANGHAITQMAEKFNLTTDEVQLLQKEAERTGSSFESMVSDATKLEATLARLRGGEVLFSREQVEQLEIAHQTIKAFNDQAAIELARAMEDPGGFFARLVNMAGPGGGGRREEPAPGLTDRQRALLEADAKAARAADQRIEAGKRILQIEKEVGEVIERTRISQLSKEERLAELQAERVELVRQLQFELTKEGEANKQLAIAKNAEEMAKIQVALAKKENVRGLPPLSDSLRAVGRFGGENQNSPAISKLGSIDRTLKNIERNTTANGDSNRFPL